MKRNTVFVAALLALLPSGAMAARHPQRPCTPMTDVQIDAESKELFSRMDRNHDGSISRIEMLGVATRHRMGATVNEKHWKMGDKNGDGRLSMEETREMVRLIDQKNCPQPATATASK